MDALRDVLRRALVPVFWISGSAAKSLEQHRAITAAVVAGDSAAARAEMHAHLARVEADVEEIVRRGIVSLDRREARPRVSANG